MSLHEYLPSRRVSTAAEQSAAHLKKGRALLEGQGAFADDDRGTADMRGHQATLVHLEFDAHPAGPMHLPALVADEGRGVLAELAEIP